MKITGYKLVIYYEDGETEDIVDIPYHIEKRIEAHLDDLEAEMEYEESEYDQRRNGKCNSGRLCKNDN